MTTEEAVQEGLRDITEAAIFLKVPRTWLRDAVTDQRVPCTRIGRHVRFTAAHLEAIIAAGEQAALAVPMRSEIQQRRTRSAARPTRKRAA